MESAAEFSNQTNPPKNKIPKKALILILGLAAAGFLLWLIFSNPRIGNAQLSWKANTEADLAGYRIYYGLSSRNSDCPSGGYANKIDAGNTTSYSITNLTNGATYYFSLTSYDASGNESCFSSELTKTIEKAKPIGAIKANFQKIFKRD